LDTELIEFSDMKYFQFLFALIIFSSCATSKKIPDSTLESDYYDYQYEGSKFSRVYVDVSGDSLKIISIDDNSKPGEPIAPGDRQLFLKRSFDIDVMTVPFKYRPATKNLPRQLNVDFNGSLFFGYRLDQYKMDFIQTPTRVIKKVRHRAITMGLFGGVGTSSITPWTTNNGTTDEYNGLILNRGISLMGGVNNLTVGIGVGWDYLTDRDKDIWIYQNKPWYGLTLSLNLN
jgi:hypothetical protein